MPLPRPKILIVDDSPDVRLSFRFMLELDDFQVIEAGSGAEALACLARERFDVALIDMYMPQINGLDIVRAVRGKAPPRPALIAMSGAPNRGYESALDAARALGADAALVKPFSRIELVQTIRGVIGGGRATLSQVPTNALHSPPPGGERRGRLRTEEESWVTGLVELTLKDPGSAATALGTDLRLGGDLAVVRSLLATAETVARQRGVDMREPIEHIKRDLRRLGYAI
jgi:CheY-like chemotaxis protein